MDVCSRRNYFDGGDINGAHERPCRKNIVCRRHPVANRRITSYNVCYTKLLRVVLKPGAEATENQIINFCRERIAHFKAPKGIEFVESLPKSPQGKILKKEVRQKYWTAK